MDAPPLRAVSMMPLRVSIRQRIAVAILICMIPILVLGVVLYHDRNLDRRALSLRAEEDAARGLAEHFAALVDNAVTTERAAGAAVTVQPYPVPGIVQLFAAIRTGDPSFLRIAIARPDGHVDAMDPPGNPRAVIGTRAVIAVREGADWAIGNRVVVGGRPGLDVAVGIRRHTGRGQLIAVMDGVVDLDELQTRLVTALPADIDGIIADDTGRVVLDLRGPAESGSAFRHLLSGGPASTGVVRRIAPFRDQGTGTWELGAAAPIASVGWTAVALQPESAALEPVRRAAAQELPWFLAYVALGLVLAWILGGELSAPILELARGARAIGRGNLDYRMHLERTDELGELGAAFNEMSAQLAQHHSEMNALQAVSDAALSTVRLNELLPALVERVVAVMRGDGGSVWFVDELTRNLILPEAFDGGPETGTRLIPIGRGLAGTVASTGRALAVSDGDLSRLDPALFASGIRAAVAVPLRAGGAVLGVIQVLSHRGTPFPPHDLQLLEAFADRVALAVDNAQAFERQREVAGVIRQALLPPPHMELSGIEIAGRFQPSREVGGDFYATLPIRDQLVGVAIADVAGKGIPAAALSARVRYLLEAFAHDGSQPGRVLERLNGVLTRTGDGELFVSLFFGLFDLARSCLRYGNAGHPFPLLLRAGSVRPETLENHGVVLGVDPRATYATTEIPITCGDTLLLFTDGVTEARGVSGDQWGEHAAAAFLSRGRQMEPDALADEMIQAVTVWGDGGGPADDRALVVVRILAGTGAAVAPS